MELFKDSALIVNILTMLIAICSTFVSYLVYKENTSPDVIVYLEQNSDAKTILDIVIENIGKSAARDISFNLNKQLVQNAFRGDTKGEMSAGALITGIPFLAPGSSRVSMFGDYHGISNFLGNEKVKVTTTFRKANGRKLFSRKITSESYIEIQSFARASSSDNTNEHKIAMSLSKIEKVLTKKLSN
ncbi:hypothetical protein [Serratia nevei]|uniref:hypothetical protein n=1 Tax=Serratia nevei TaxID=2703794 RepID=UPI003FA760BA